MKKKGDFGDLLMEEVLAETADDFFGRRKKIENQIEILKTHARVLADKSCIIAKHLSFFNHLLRRPEHVKAFYEKLGIVDSDILLKEERPFFELVPKKFKTGVLLKTTYCRMVMFTYDRLQTLCGEYLCGDPDEGTCNDADVKGDPPVSLKMVMHMVDLINQGIRRVNTGKTPAAVLQFAKSFNTVASQKESITGAMSSDYHRHLNAKMHMDPVRMVELQLDHYPELPKMAAIQPVLKDLCTHLTGLHKKEIEHILSEFKTFRKQKKMGS